MAALKVKPEDRRQPMAVRSGALLASVNPQVNAVAAENARRDRLTSRHGADRLSRAAYREAGDGRPFIRDAAWSKDRRGTSPAPWRRCCLGCSAASNGVDAGHALVSGHTPRSPAVSRVTRSRGGRDRLIRGHRNNLFPAPSFVPSFFFAPAEKQNGMLLIA